jgi:hypothetical protein
VTTLASIDLDRAGGQLVATDIDLTVTVPAEVLGGTGATLQVSSVLAPPPGGGGLRAGSRPFEITLTNLDSGEQLHALPAPLSLTYVPTAEEVALADGDFTRLAISTWTGSAWLPLPCSHIDQALVCTLTHLSTFDLMVAPIRSGALDYDVPDGHFFRQTNGFGGAGQNGYLVTDDATAAFWTEYQRYGGVDQVGYPITNRFLYRGFLTQAFQKLALQWRPELGQAVPVNVLDELGNPADSWLDDQRQVPASSGLAMDPSTPWEDVVSAHVALLDSYPALRSFYDADPTAVDDYGLPVAVQDYGSFVTARLQRATLQLWTVDTPWASAGSVVLGNAGDLAKEAGLWPSEASVPEVPPTASTPESAAPDQ